MSKKGAGAKKEDEKGSGLASTLLLAGGAAALGYLANDLWTAWKGPQQQEQGHQSTSGGADAQGRSTSWENKKDNMKARKESRGRVYEKDVPEAVKCVICLENPREVILVPCGHASMCVDCAEKLPANRCPICNQSIHNKKNVYLS